MFTIAWLTSTPYRCELQLPRQLLPHPPKAAPRGALEVGAALRRHGRGETAAGRRGAEYAGARGHRRSATTYTLSI